MMTTRITITMIANIFCMAKDWRLNSNSRHEIMYKAKVAGYQTVTGPMFPEKLTFIYQVGDYTLIPIWTDARERLRAAYIVCDEKGLPLTETEFKEIEELLKA